MWIGTETVGASEVDDARFNCNVGNIGTIAQARATLTNKANWLTNNFPTPPPFPLPSNCSFLNLSVLPVALVNFTGKINADKTGTLQWKMETEIGVDHYILEKSTDGLHFTDLGLAYPNSLNNGVYNITDPSLSNGVNYYRLRIEKGNGDYVYSAVVALSLRSGLSVTVYPNPVKDEVTIQQIGNIHNTTIQLVDIRGHLIQQIQLTGPVYKLNMSKLSSGIYFLKTGDGSIFKLIKQ
ncbi:MAG: T9SS type A sorting domain-containing protein [Chitinophagaceae bacterium]|nr:T9SS type A sorting domain-containing protein [Chitinophagaceae bacterium]